MHDGEAIGAKPDLPSLGVQADGQPLPLQGHLLHVEAAAQDVADQTKRKPDVRRVLTVGFRLRPSRRYGRRVDSETPLRGSTRQASDD